MSFQIILETLLSFTQIYGILKDFLDLISIWKIFLRPFMDRFPQDPSTTNNKSLVNLVLFNRSSRFQYSTSGNAKRNTWKSEFSSSYIQTQEAAEPSTTNSVNTRSLLAHPIQLIMPNSTQMLSYHVDTSKKQKIVNGEYII